MKIKLIGTGSMISKRNPACYLINNKIMIDFPNGTAKILKNADLFELVEYVFITHIHGDHIFDLPFLFLDRYKSNRELNVFISPRWFRKIKKLVKLAFPSQYYNIFYNSKIRFISNSKVISFDNLNIKSIKVSHGRMKPSFGYFLEDNAKVFFTGDSCLCDNILNVCDNIDILFSDCTLKKGNNKHMGVDNVKDLLKKYPKLKIVPVHTSINSKNELKKIKNKNLLIKEDMEEINL